MEAGLGSKSDGGMGIETFGRLTRWFWLNLASLVSQVAAGSEGSSW